MKVKDIMQKDPIRVFPDTSLSSLFNLFKRAHSFPLIPVVNSQAKVIGEVKPENLLDILRPPQAGLFRNNPLVRIKEEVFDLERTPSLGKLIIVDDIMDKHFNFVKDSNSLVEAYQSMRNLKEEKLIVLDSQGGLVGIVEIFDVIKSVFKEKGIFDS